MKNLTKMKYVCPTITFIMLTLEHGLANSSVTIKPGSNQSRNPLMEDWVEEVDSNNLSL